MRAGRNWNRARQEAHDRLIALVRDSLLSPDGRAIPEASIHTEATVGSLPSEYGLRSRSEDVVLTPDLVAADRTAGEVLIIEVTIVPCAALAKYVSRKRKKYAGLSRGVGGTRLDGGFTVRPPLVVAVGTGGTLPDCTAEAYAAMRLPPEGFDRFAAEAAAIAGSRADARPQARSRAPVQRHETRRGRRRARGLTGREDPASHASP